MLHDIFLPAVALADPQRHVVLVVVNGSNRLGPKERRSLGHACMASGVKVMFRNSNAGMDFGAYSAGLAALDKSRLKFNSYVFLNDSVAGPLHPKDPSVPFAEMLQLLDDGADLAGQSINPLVDSSRRRPPMPHVQSMAFALTR
jgi:lipopolysaccharide biosynthesis protein